MLSEGPASESDATIDSLALVLPPLDETRRPSPPHRRVRLSGGRGEGGPVILRNPREVLAVPEERRGALSRLRGAGHPEARCPALLQLLELLRRARARQPRLRER